jgi:PmbA protein
MEEALKVAREALDRIAARGLGGEVELYLQQARTTTVKVYAGEVESVSVAEPRGVGARYIADGRSGYSYTSGMDVGSMVEAVVEAAANSQAADFDEYAGLPDLSGGAGRRESTPSGACSPAGGYFAEGVSTTPLPRKIELAVEAEKRALAEFPVETVEESTYQDADTWVGVVSNLGAACVERRSFAALFLSAHARDGGDVQTGLGYSIGREPQALVPEQAGADAARKAKALLGARQCPTGTYPVVLTPEVSSAFVAFVAQALDADQVQRGRSLFAGRLGDTVASSVITIVDDGLHRDGLVSGSFDDEGVGREEAVPLVERGVLRSFLHNAYTARRQGDNGVSTANASRSSYRSAPVISPSNLLVKEGVHTQMELVGSIDRGLLIQAVGGLHSGANPITGQFSVGATGFLIEKGELGRPVKEVTIASDLCSLLEGVSQVGADGRWVPLHGSVRSPSILIGRMTVSGL